MIEATPTPVGASTENPQLVERRGRIGWICQGVRLAAIVYALWVIYALAAFYGNVEAINKGYGRLLQKDLSGVLAWQQAAAFSVNFAVWLIAAAACYSTWRLFTNYLEGKIFTFDSALWLRRLGLYGVVAQLLGIATRPLVSVILTLHFPAGEGQRIVSVFLQPDDLAILLLLFGLVALAHVQKTAAEIAGEHAQFV